MPTMPALTAGMPSSSQFEHERFCLGDASEDEVIPSRRRQFHEIVLTALEEKVADHHQRHERRGAEESCRSTDGDEIHTDNYFAIIDETETQVTTHMELSGLTGHPISLQYVQLGTAHGNQVGERLQTVSCTVPLWGGWRKRRSTIA